VIGVVPVIDIGDAEFDFEHRCRKGHAIVSTRVAFPECSGRRGTRKDGSRRSASACRPDGAGCCRTTTRSADFALVTLSCATKTE
jgi:hypothetical protein